MPGSDASPQAQPQAQPQLESEEKQQPRTSEDDTDMPDPAKKEQKADENVHVESCNANANTGSDGGKGGGSGSGEGYSADYSSSSDASSLGATKAEKQMHRLSLDGGGTNEKTTTRAQEAKPSKGLKQQGAQKSQQSAQTESCYLPDCESSAYGSDSGSDYDYESSADGSQYIPVVKQNSLLPVRILRPMDPRIDLSTVSHIHTSSVPAFPTNVDIPSRKSSEPPENSGVGPPPPSIDQYIKLMEVVHPFFHAHGVAQGYAHARSDEPSNEQPSFDVATEPSNSDQKPVAATTASPYAIYPNEDLPKSDSSSPEDPTNHGPNTSANEGPNVSSSSSDKKVRIIQQPQHAETEDLRKEHGPMDQDDSDEDPGEEMRSQAHKEEEPETARRHESTLTSSVEERNNEEDALQDLPLRCGLPAAVSEYSSSARASSGASNNNIMSTSGSGSGGNTASGTASGSNEGGSSGSGNDQGGSSANGNGSTASGNDAKGSSEETMDNSGENNSGENSGGNSDEPNSNNEKGKTAAAVAADASHVSAGHRHSSNASETLYRDPALQPQPLQAHDDGHHNAAREKKLQDKKRKRMNMRREYEEKVQQEMESSEGSRDRGESFLRPGRPVTLDKVLSFTKIARIVIKAGPPFLVVYTNAAYSRLSGLSCVVGSPLSSLLSLPPDLDTLAKIGNGNEGPSIETSTVGAENVCESVHQEENGPFENEMKNENGSAGSQTHSVAEAAGPAQAAASQEDSTEMGLERLVAASGFGRCHVIHVSAKPHHMLGRNVTVMKQVNTNGPEMKSREEGMSNGSSITSGYDGPYHIPCSMGVSPVVSSPEAFTDAVVTDKDQHNHHHKTKRRKHHHHSDSQQSNATHHQHHRNNLTREVHVHRKRHLITHYVIELELYEGTFRKFGSLESHSSTSTTVEAQMLGLTKSELRRQRTRGPALQAQAEDGSDRLPDDEDDDEMESESSEPREPVAAIG